MSEIFTSSSVLDVLSPESVCRFFNCLQTLVGCGLSGPTSPLAFAEAVMGAISRSAGSLQNKEQLLRMWTVVVGSLTDIITQVIVEWGHLKRFVPLSLHQVNFQKRI